MKQKVKETRVMERETIQKSRVSPKNDKSRRNLFTVLICLLCAASFASCEKPTDKDGSDSGNNFDVRLISRMEMWQLVDNEEEGYYYAPHCSHTFTYDSQKQISGYDCVDLEDNSLKLFVSVEYSGNSIIEHRTSNPGTEWEYSYIYTHLVNVDGFITTYRYDPDDSSSSHFYTNGYLTGTNFSNSSGTETLVWEDGNLKSVRYKDEWGEDIYNMPAYGTEIYKPASIDFLWLCGEGVLGHLDAKPDIIKPAAWYGKSSKNLFASPYSYTLDDKGYIKEVYLSGKLICRVEYLDDSK